MASKFTKLVLLTAVAAAVGAGVYYYVQKKNSELYDDDGEAFEGDDEDKSRSYVSLKFDNVECALQKAKEKIADSYAHVVDSVKAGVTREFTDLTREEEASGESSEDASKE